MIRALQIGILLAVTLASQSTANAQMRVSGGLTVRPDPVASVAPAEAPATRRNFFWRSRNPYYAARPVFPARRPGQRANVTFEPYSRWYYPTEKSYYPPVPTPPTIPR